MVALFRTAIGSSGIGWPGGWTELKDSTADASDDAQGLAWKRAAVDEPATITLATASAKFAGLIIGIDSAIDPVAGDVSTDAFGTSTTPDPANLSAGSTDAYTWLWLGGWEGEQTDPPAAHPTNYAWGLFPRSANSGTAGVVTTNCRVAASYRVLTASSEDPGSATISVSDDWIAWTMVLRPKRGLAFPRNDQRIIRPHLVTPEVGW